MSRIKKGSENKKKIEKIELKKLIKKEIYADIKKNIWRGNDERGNEIAMVWNLDTMFEGLRAPTKKSSSFN